MNRRMTEIHAQNDGMRGQTIVFMMLKFSLKHIVLAIRASKISF